MRRASLLVPSLLALLALPAPAARAQDPLPGRMPQLQLPPRMQTPLAGVVVGGWVEYSMVDRKTAKRLRLHWALVGQEGSKRWWELTIRDGQQPAMRIKSLVRGPVNQPSHVERVIVQTGSQTPLELPLKQGQQLVDVYTRPRPGGRIRDLGTEKIVTAAGTFESRHHAWTDADGFGAEEWTSPAVALWGLVRFQNRRFLMELVGHGKNARSQVTGVPVRWQIPGYQP